MATWTTDDGTQINFELRGDMNNQQVLLLLPGLLGSMASQWRSFSGPLSADFRLITTDLRGHGRSGNEAPDLRYDRMVQDIEGLLAYLGISRVSVAGFDLGGYLALALALNQPKLVKSVLMHGTKFYWTKDAAAKLREQLDPDSMAKHVPAYADQLVQEHGGRNWRVLVRQAADLVALLAQEGITEGMVARTQCPVMVSLGDRDEMVPLMEAQRLSRILPDGKLLVLPGVRHSFQTVRLIPLLPMMQFFHKTAKH